MKPKTLNITDFSHHIFWDVNIENMDLVKSKRLIIHRVLDYGLMSDWQIALKFYGITEIADTAKSLRDLDEKSASFVALLSKTPQEQFLCFSSKQSMPKQSIF